MKILIAEDERVSRRLLQSRLEKWGYEVTAAEDGRQAWEIFQEQHFPMVISDWMMPNMDGLELLRRIRSSERPGYVYTILLTARSEKEDILAGMDSGADDFIAKPFDKDELLARLKVGRRITDLERDLAQRNHELQKINQRMSRDLQAAAKIQQSLLPTKLPECEAFNFAWKYVPCDELAGDTLNLFFLDEAHLGLYLLDVSGHGVTAALLSVNLSRILTPNPQQSDLLKEAGPGKNGYRLVSPEDVADRLNQRFPLDSSTEQYFTIQYGCLDLGKRELTYISAGHPPMIHLPATGPGRALQVKSLPIGFMVGVGKIYREQKLTLAPGDRLYFYSDGIIEAMNNERQQFGVERLIKTLEELLPLSLNESLEQLSIRIDQWTAGAGCGDDFSILAVEGKV
ncbi:MAG: SpoIIE family protein phosphatase [Deltaproteobacteria bacterium]|nr:SpoIIE family protein phosphatase [Deltaproteobacteria bacterium]